MPRAARRRADRRVDLETLRKSAQVHRLAFGMTLSAGIAFYYAWPLAFISPVLCAKLLSLPRVIPLKAGVGIVAILGATFLASSTLLLPTLAYPPVHLLLVGLILFHLFYAKARGANPIVVVFAVIGVLAIPLVGSISRTLAEGVARGMTMGAALAVVMVYVSAALFPDPVEPGGGEAGQPGRVGREGDVERESEGSAAAGEEGAGAEDPDAEARRTQTSRIALALRSWAVIYPLYVIFLLFSLVNLAVILIFAALLGLEPTFGRHWAAGRGLILSNLAGGLVAVVLYKLLVWVPAYAFFLLLVALAGLVVGRLIFSGTPLGKLMAAGITTVFVVLGPTLTGEAEAGAKLYLRVVQIMAAVLYVVTAFGIIERLTRGRRVEA